MHFQVSNKRAIYIYIRVNPVNIHSQTVKTVLSEVEHVSMFLLRIVSTWSVIIAITISSGHKAI